MEQMSVLVLAWLGGGLLKRRLRRSLVEVLSFRWPLSSLLILSLHQ